MKRALGLVLILVACQPERPPETGIVHDPRERERALAEVQADAARKHDLEADAADRAAIERRRAEKAEAERAAVAERETRCAAEGEKRAAALAGLDAEVAAARAAAERRQKAEQWLLKHCRVYARKEKAAELYTDARGNVRRREVVTGTTDAFQACPAKTPADIAREAGLSYDDTLGWVRYGAPPSPPTADQHRAARLQAIAAMRSPDCPGAPAP